MHIPEVVMSFQAPGYPGSVPLNAREVTVLSRLAEGWTTREIARELGCSERTVKDIVYGITTLRGFRNRTHAVAVAIREGVI